MMGRIFRGVIGLAVVMFCVAGMSFAGQVEMKTVVAEFPVAILADADNTAPVGTLERNGNSYTVYAPGIGFQVGDTFTVSSDNGSYAIIFLNKKRTSSVKLYEGAKIVFLDSGNIDSYDVAITGVYIENADDSNTYALTQFDINTASPTNEFLVYTPDAVVGVRGTKFNVKVPKPNTSNPTRVIPVENNGVVHTWDPSIKDLFVRIYDLLAIKAIKGQSFVLNASNIKGLILSGTASFLESTALASFPGGGVSAAMTSPSDFFLTSDSAYVIDSSSKSFSVNSTVEGEDEAFCGKDARKQAGENFSGNFRYGHSDIGSEGYTEDADSSDCQSGGGC